MNELIIDRIKEDWAVIKYGNKTFNIPLFFLPKRAKEGDAINVLVTVDENATKSRSDDTRLAKEISDSLPNHLDTEWLQECINISPRRDCSTSGYGRRGSQVG